MARDIATKKKLHLSRIPAVGTSVLTKCGRKKETMPNGIGAFTNPKATLCAQCIALSEADGLTVSIEWREGLGKWVVFATPPMLERQGNRIIDRNNPDAPPVYLDVDKLLDLSGLALDDYYNVHGPQQKELTAG